MRKTELNGAWQILECGKEEICDVTVPGTVLSGFLAEKKIEDPFYRTNEDTTRELFWKDYEFKRSFEISEELLKEEKTELVCEGLDTLTEIYVNGEFVAKTDNMHRIWKFDIKHLLKSGKNEIRIIFRSVLKYIEEHQPEEKKEIQYVPCGCMRGNQWIRKAHSMFGWDWGPQTIDAGIFRDIYLESYSHARIEDVRIRQIHGKSVTVNAEVKLSGEFTGKNKIQAKISECGAEESEIQSKEAEEESVFSFEIKSPKLWWPNGYGEQPLYLIEIELRDENDTVLEVVKKRIGLRTLTISQEKDEWGNEFCFCVNGLKIFTKGGNYIPEDCLYTRITQKQQRYLLESCKRANFNCVRVWGGGYYPSDAFYDLCDEMGLIVWQDMMYACNVYDVTDEFAENCRIEALQNVARLRHHASLGLWCGNNEIESAWNHWPDFQAESDYLRADYIKLFEDVVPKAVKSADDETFYWPSSPSSGGCFDNPDDENRGDTHYWDVWHGQKPFSDYQNYYFRFCSEFGFQSFPCMKTVKSFTKESDRNIFSRVMENHQKNAAANGKILYYLSENFRYPNDLEHLLYVSQILQGVAIKSGVDHWRRNRGRCMGTLYWQVNDNWPVASWSSIDYFGRWKALHYMAKKFYAPLALSMKREEEKLSVWLSNESGKTEEYEVQLFVKNMKCKELALEGTSGDIKAFSAKEILSLNLKEWEEKKYKIFFEAKVKTKSGVALREVETMVPYKYLELEKSNLQIEIEEQEKAFEITVKSDCFTPFAEIDFEGADAILEDNFVHITAKEGVKIQVLKEDIWNGTFENAEDMRNRIKILTLN